MVGFGLKFLSGENGVESKLLRKFALMKILIADAGGTSVDWCVILPDSPERRFRSAGCNAALMSDAELNEALRASLALSGGQVDAVVFYGAGCVAGGSACRRVECAIRSLYPSAGRVEVHSDLLGAARALCGRLPGIACILGTGSNSGVYDGRNIVDNTPPLGYILGDEGSGASLGRRFVADVLKGLLPRHLLDMTQDEIIERVYRRPAANRFLAGLTPVIKSLAECDSAVRELVVDEFSRFLDRNVARYRSGLPLHFVGGVAAGFEPELREAAVRGGFRVESVVASPMDGLVRYHSAEMPSTHNT